jgi:hypothetical protein
MLLTITLRPAGLLRSFGRRRVLSWDMGHSCPGSLAPVGPVSRREPCELARRFRYLEKRRYRHEMPL